MAKQIGSCLLIWVLKASGGYRDRSGLFHDHADWQLPFLMGFESVVLHQLCSVHDVPQSCLRQLLSCMAITVAGDIAGTQRPAGSITAQDTVQLRQSVLAVD